MIAEGLVLCGYQLLSNKDFFFFTFVWSLHLKAAVERLVCFKSNQYCFRPPTSSQCVCFHTLLWLTARFHQESVLY